jgi:purine nucleosidase
VIIDTDAGVDDALALIFALHSPELAIEAITTVSGNVHVDLCTENALRVLEAVDTVYPPVARGEADPLVRPLFTAPEVHGIDGLGGLHGLYPPPQIAPVPETAWELMADMAWSSPGEIALIALGPLTNVAKAIVERPADMEKLSEIICMGGAFRTYGNTTTVSEFNVYVDPHAAAVVADSGIPLTFVPLDITEQVRMHRAAVPTGFIAELTQGYLDYHRETEGLEACYLHDPVAVGYAIDKTICKTREGFVQVEINPGVTLGMTVCDLRDRPVIPHSPNARICTHVDHERFLRLFLSRISI